MKKIKNSKRFLRNVICLFILFCLNSAGLMSQVKVSGIITDVNKDPLIGVNITVKGIQTGTISDFNGKYYIQVPSVKSVLVFSYIGHKKVEKTVGTNTVIDVLMEEDSKLMDEVVVVAYGTQKKSHLTGSVASLKGDKLDEIPVSRLDQALQGKMAGVQVLSLDPQAGEAPVIRVRGMGSISANNAPLVVIDGFPTPDGLSMISPGDVESVEVLKDAASAALYGSRAAGGVILITTKSGNVTKPKYNFKMFSGVKTALKLPVMLNTLQYTQLLYDEAAQRELDTSIDGTNLAFNNVSEADKASYLVEKYLDDQPTNWLDEGLRKFGLVQNYQLSAAGGDKNMKYFISGNYTKEDGIMKASTYDKYSFRAKVDVKLSKAITIGINLTPTYSQKETPANDLTDYMRTPSWLPIRHNAATAASTGKTVGDYASLADFFSTSISGIGIDGNTWNVDAASLSGSSSQNPVSIRERTSILTDDYKLLGNSYLTIDFMKGLQFKTSNGGYVSYREYNKKEMTSATKAGVPNSLTRQMTLHSELLSENTLNYNKKLGNHEFGALLGFTMQKTSDSYNQMVATSFPDENMLSFNLASQLILDSPSASGIRSFYYSEALMSYLGRITYAYKGKYMLSGSLRSDGSSKFDSNKWGTFPAGSIGWRASEEGFLKNQEWLSNLKLRASYGLTGNNKIPQYSYMNSVNTSNYVLGSGIGTLTPGMASNNLVVGNLDITWEQTAEANYGVDFGLFNSKINLSVEYYNSNTIQLLLQQPIMFITGYQSFWKNIGKVNNQGVEVELTTTNIDSKGFTWKTSANLSTNKNTLLNYGNKDRQDNFGERNEVYRAIVGQPSIQFFGYKSSGVYTTFQEVSDAIAITDVNGVAITYSKFYPVLGGLKVVDKNNDNKVDPNDREVLGNPFPNFTWGITNTFSYANFDLSFLFQGVQGVSVINGNLNYNEMLRTNTAYTNNRYVSPMYPGDSQTTYDKYTSGGDLMLTDYAIEDASYAALRDFTLGYKLPKKVIKSLKIADFRLYFSAQNLVYIMAPGYRGINPEARKTSGNYSSPLLDGYQRGVFPLNRTYTIGLDLTF